ncbi:MAG: cell division protein ZapA [Cytophagales bacterium]|nr:cell division protein ZapA [Hyphobacterium sp. CCMP332]
MDTLSIKLKIADRDYPLKVAYEEEEHIRKTARILNEKIKEYRDNFGIEDKQDLLAMVAFEILVDKLNLDSERQVLFSNLNKQVQSIESKIAEFI